MPQKKFISRGARRYISGAHEGSTAKKMLTLSKELEENIMQEFLHQEAIPGKKRCKHKPYQKDFTRRIYQQRDTKRADQMKF